MKFKVFISCPMNGKSDEEIMEIRRNAELRIKHDWDFRIEIIDSFFRGAPADAKPLWYLGESLKELSRADMAYFTKDWAKSRGCRIEHEAAVAYGIEVIYE